MVKNKKKKGSHQKNKKSSHTNYHTNKNNENNNENNNELSANATSSNRPCLLVGQFHCQQMQWNRNLHNETVSSNVKSRLKQMLPRSREEALSADLETWWPILIQVRDWEAVAETLGVDIKPMDGSHLSSLAVLHEANPPPLFRAEGETMTAAVLSIRMKQMAIYDGLLEFAPDLLEPNLRELTPEEVSENRGYEAEVGLHGRPARTHNMLGMLRRS
tara:strand:+ start:1356 stop:2006 length:651 start_codon:yes stop_codon:yes gene_type:complete